MHKNPSSGKRHSHLLGEEIFHFYAIDMWEAVFSWGKRYSKRIPLPQRDALEHLFGEAVFSCGKRDSLTGKGIFMHKTFQNQISLRGSSQLWECSFPHIFWKITLPPSGENTASRKRDLYALGSSTSPRMRDGIGGFFDQNWNNDIKFTFSFWRTVSYVRSDAWALSSSA